MYVLSGSTYHIPEQPETTMTDFTHVRFVCAPVWISECVYRVVLTCLVTFITCNLFLIVLVLIITIIYWHYSWVVITELMLGLFLWLITTPLLLQYLVNQSRALALKPQALKKVHHRYVSIILCNVLKCYSALSFMFSTCFIFFLSPLAVCFYFCRPNHIWDSFSLSRRRVQDESGVASVEKCKILQQFLFYELPIEKRAKMTRRHGVARRHSTQTLLHPPLWTSLQLHYGCCAVSFTWLENGNVMNQRLYVQRPSVLNRLLRLHYAEREGKKQHHTYSPHPSHQKYNHWCFKLMLRAYETISYGNEYCRSFLVSLLCGRGVVGQVCQHSLPPVYSCKSIACCPGSE